MVGAIFSNLSVFYDTYFDDNYPSSTYNQLLSTNNEIISGETWFQSDNIQSGRMLMTYPNSLQALLDTFLLRGTSHRISYHIEIIDSGQNMRIFFSYPHNYMINDSIQINNSSNSFGINDIYKVISIDSLTFTVENIHLIQNNIDGVFYTKRPPVRI